MYYNNMNGKEDDDLKFIPLNISEPFRDKDSTWFPIIDMALPTFSEVPNTFTLSFANTNPIDNSNLQVNNLNTLGYIQNDNSNLQNNGNKQVKNFEKNFNLEYPSETLNEELMSYNKENKCKKNANNSINKNNNTTNIQKSTSDQMSNFNEMNNPNVMNNPNIINNPSAMNKTNSMNNTTGMQNINNESMINNRDYIEEPIHMELLRNLNFDSYLNKSYRGEEENKSDQIDIIFGSIKNDNSIIETFKAYNIPRPIYELVIKKIIQLAVDEANCKRGD
ncbi:MAG: hypothetical protein MR510_16005 [Clostridium sp.]|uniref:hypothetical protein n=1 Tax=Clostridium sp. TaxID=1506 RepID=UPI00280AF54A|nr:hypothetical protein [Clostridium sp.]MCI6693946.1 hypothetical protein [Clostridium sp.]MDY2630034.1 hypothetical protein [Clostridium sp.]